MTERQHERIWAAGMRAWGGLTLGSLRDVAGKRARAWARRQHPDTPRLYARLVNDYATVFYDAAIYAAGEQADRKEDWGLAAEVRAYAEH